MKTSMANSECEKCYGKGWYLAYENGVPLPENKWHFNEDPEWVACNCDSASVPKCNRDAG